MGASIYDGIRFIAMGKMLIEAVPAECKFNYLHSRISGFSQQILDILAENSKILGYDFCRPNRFAYGIRQFLSRPFFPLP